MLLLTASYSCNKATSSFLPSSTTSLTVLFGSSCGSCSSKSRRYSPSSGDLADIIRIHPAMIFNSELFAGTVQSGARRSWRRNKTQVDIAEDLFLRRIDLPTSDQ